MASQPAPDRFPLAHLCASSRISKSPLTSLTSFPFSANADMGFIYTGSGFKRRYVATHDPSVALPLRKPNSGFEAHQNQPLHDFHKSGSAPPMLQNAASSHLPHLSHIQHSVSDLASTATIDSLDSAQTQVARFYNDTTLPSWRDPHVTPAFVDLPAEILFRIYCSAGVGPGNSLASTCTYLRELFDYTRNSYFFEMIVQSQYLLTLSAGSGGRNWHERFQKRLRTLPPSFDASATIEAAFLAPLASFPHFAAIDSQVFTLPNISETHVKFLKDRFGGSSVDRAAADRQRKLKRRFFEWKYMVLKKFVALATEAFQNGTGVNSTSDSIFLEAENSEACVQFKKTHELENFVPISESAGIPRSVLKRVDGSKLLLIRALTREYGMQIADPVLLVASFFARNGDLGSCDGQAVDCLFELVAHNLVATAGDIANALKVFDECRHRIFTLSLDEREGHPISAAVSRFYDYLKEILTYYYETHPEDNSSAIWELLKQIEIPELLDHVVGLGVNVPLHMF